MPDALAHPSLLNRIARVLICLVFVHPGGLLLVADQSTRI